MLCFLIRIRVAVQYIVLATMLCPTFGHAEIGVIASNTCKMKSLTKSDIRQLFMLKKKYVNDEYIVVVDSSDTSIYSAFLEQFISKSSYNMKAYWTRMLFTGRKIPPKKFLIDELDELKEENNCYITYVDLQNKPALWKTITVE